MAKNQNVRLRPQFLHEDRNVHTALQSLTDYAPANSAYTKTALAASLAAMKSAQDAELAAQNALAAARDAANAAEWDFHNAILSAKDQVVAQYGKDSDQVQALGMKKKSERKTPIRKNKGDRGKDKG
jgi:hypothetical protein